MAQHLAAEGGVQQAVAEVARKLRQAQRVQRAQDRGGTDPILSLGKQRIKLLVRSREKPGEAPFIRTKRIISLNANNYFCSLG